MMTMTKHLGLRDMEEWVDAPSSYIEFFNANVNIQDEERKFHR